MNRPSNINLRLPAPMRARVDAWAKAKGLRSGELIRVAIDAYCDRLDAKRDTRAPADQPDEEN